MYILMYSTPVVVPIKMAERERKKSAIQVTPLQFNLGNIFSKYGHTRDVDVNSV